MSFYLIDDIEQGTIHWHDWRKGVIGASEAVIIMGENRWKGRQQLMDEKLGLLQPFSGNAATREGHLLEEHARFALEKKFKHKLNATIVQDEDEPFLAASLDAINSKNTQIYEIKCGVRTYETVANNRKVPSYYVAQIQHMLMVTQMESLIFAAYRPDQQLITFNVVRDEGYIRELRKKEIAFIRELQSRGHLVQTEFRGYYVGEIEPLEYLEKKREIVDSQESEWILIDGVFNFWDGKDFLEGEESGFYELGFFTHYWNGEKWILPKKIGTYEVEGEEIYWDGSTWEWELSKTT